MPVSTNGMPQPFAMEHRQRVQVHVAIVHAGVKPEGRGVDPQVAMRELHAFGARSGCLAGVVDGGGGVLVARPGYGRSRGFVQLARPTPRRGIARRLQRHARERLGKLGVDEQERCAGVRHDVLDLGRAQPGS